jgi:peptidoglycan/LPS O-acetylase OafA/YrhL
MVALDSLRGVCASIVAFFHVDGDALIKTVPFVANGFLFVDFFFVLSGFVIAASYGEKIVTGFPIGKFMFLRLGRLYPLHAFMLFAYVFIAIFKHSQGAGAN